MATQNDTTMANGRTSQVKIHLTSRSEDIQLPQDTGAILVSTGMSFSWTNKTKEMRRDQLVSFFYPDPFNQTTY
jgi:hypothetical protein